MATVDVVVVGGGQAGLSMGYMLQKAGYSFVIIERGRVGESWRSQRWDSFALNTPNWANGFPGYPYDDGPSDGFGLRDELVAYMERYVAAFDLPVVEHTAVTAVTRHDGAFAVAAMADDGGESHFDARAVVLASGLMQTPKTPAIAEKFPSWIHQLHTAEYRSPAELPDGAVLVVGSAQSGVQISEDLLRAGRQLYLCTSRVARLPRRYRGRDLLEWFDEMGLWDITLDELPDPAMQFAAQPQVSGVGRYGSTLSLQHLWEEGAHLMGRLADVVDGVVTSDDSLEEHLQFADEFSAQGKADVDAYIEANGIEAPPPEPDPIDAPAGPEVAAAAVTELDLRAGGVGTVIWCTGFTANLDWVEPSVVDDHGRPVHQRGVSDVEGLYFLGFPWLHKRKSGVIFGVEEDADYLMEHIGLHLGDPA